jgi:hypothetical protein
MRNNLTILITVMIIFVWNFQVYAFEGNTHKALTEKAISNNNQSILDDYLKNELGMGQGLNNVLVLDRTITPDANRVLPQIPPYPSILDYLKAGACLEDIPLPRAKHHFHDPYRNAGLDNKSEHPIWASIINYLTQKEYNGLSFDLTGASALKRASGTEGSLWETEYQNYFAWPDARGYFYQALTQETEVKRKHYLALTFLSLGHTIHLLEDMGVPPHTRNDFIEAHFRVPKGLWGNPFETYVENEIGTSGIPSKWIDGWSPQAKVFSKLAYYFDTNTRDPNEYLGSGVPPLGTWGLSEQTNYQFLSKSTIFRENNGTLYYFPHPNVNNVTGYIKAGVYIWNSIPVRYRYISGYDITHLARTKYIDKYASAAGMLYPVPIGTVVYHTTFDKFVYEDYAKVTIPRTIDSATGLTNYFFRGRISATIECIDCNVFEVTITNQSSNSGVQQTLKGGIFELYWDDASGNRTKITGFEIDGGWTSSSTLSYGASTTGTFTKTEGEVEKYILVYKGNICANPAEPDYDDENSIAITIIAAPLDDCCEEWPECLCNLTNSCPRCFPTNETPENVFIVLSNIEDSINGIYCAEYFEKTYSKGYVAAFVNSKYGGEDGFIVITYVISEFYGDSSYCSQLYVSPQGYDPIWFGHIGIENCGGIYGIWSPECSTFFYGQNGFLLTSGTATVINPCNDCYGATLWINSHSYSVMDKVITEGCDCYKCIKSHISNSDNRPPTGTSWGIYWVCVYE